MNPHTLWSSPRTRIAIAGLAIVACANFSMPGAARADSIPQRSAVCVPGAQGEKVGIVIALAGSAWAQSENCGETARRALACGSLLYGGESVVTGAGSNTAIEIQDTRVQVGPESEVALDVSADGASEIALQQGSVRVVDPEGASGPGRRLSTPDLVSVGRGDTEASALPGQASSLCEYALPLAIEKGPVRTLDPGACTGAGITSLAAGALGVSLLDAGSCVVADDRFDPIDVAAGPSTLFPPPSVPPPPAPSCLTGACGGDTPPPPPPAPPTIIESPGQNEPPPP